MSCAMLAARDLGPGKHCVVILPDSVRNYMTKFLSDQWMMDKDFITESDDSIKNLWWSKEKLSVLQLPTPLTVLPTISCQEAIAIMKKERCGQLPVVDNEGIIQGVVTLDILMANIISSKIEGSSPVQKSLYTQITKITLDTTLGKLFRILDRDNFALIVNVACT
ncbi:unnamed protein product, partial [Meganyctiphanes norvegica]